MHYSLTLDSKGRALELLQELPGKGDTFPTVILVSGFGVDLHEHGLFDEVSTMLVKNSFQVFRFSFAGTGKSEGNFADMTIEDQAEQLQTVISYALKDRFTDKEAVGIFAHSFGVPTTVAALPLPDIKAFMFSAASVEPYESLSKLYKRQHEFNPDGISVVERSDKTKTSIGPQFWKSVSLVPFIQKSELITQPTLLIHGSKDQYVKAWESQEYYNHIKGRKKFLLVEKADHAYTRAFRPTVLSLVADWFNETLHGIELTA